MKSGSVLLKAVVRGARALADAGGWQPAPGQLDVPIRFKMEAIRYTGDPMLNFCTAGEYFDPATSDCKHCASGRFQRHGGRQECRACPPGKFIVHGMRADAHAQTCDSCPLEKYQPERGQGGCKACATGQATNFTGALFCVGR